MPRQVKERLTDLNLKLKLIKGATAPSYSTKGSSGMDVYAHLEEELTVPPLSRVLVPTGFYIEIPEGYEIQVRPRSGLAIRNGITVLNTPGTIDSDYRGEVKIILINLSDTPFVIHDKDRIAQIVLSKVERMDFSIVSELSESGRGEGGFGSTGV